MPVPTLITSLSTTAASNSPPGGESIAGNMDDYLRAAFAFIAELRDRSSFTQAITFTAGVTLGDAAGDALTINSSAVSIPNGLNFDANTLVIDATNNRVGIGRIPTAQKFEVQGFVAAYTGAVETVVTGGDGVAFGVVGTLTNHALALFTNNAERVRVHTNGRVGVGITSLPDALFHVNGASFLAAAPITAHAAQGAYVEWNTSGGGGETNFVNQKGGGSVGGFNFQSTSAANTRSTLLTITEAGVISDNAGLELGYKDIPIVAGFTTGTLTAAHRGKGILASGAITVPTGLTAGTAVLVFNNSASAISIAQGAGMTLRNTATGADGSRTLAAWGQVTIWYAATTFATISGTGLS